MVVRRVVGISLFLRLDIDAAELFPQGGHLLGQVHARLSASADLHLAAAKAATGHGAAGLTLGVDVPIPTLPTFNTVNKSVGVEF